MTLRALPQKANVDLVDLTDFDVQIALTQNNGVQVYDVLSIVTQFMVESFQGCLPTDPSFATFDTVILLERSQRRQLEALERELGTTTDGNGQVTVGQLFTAKLKGATLFNRNVTQNPVPSSAVDACQRQAFLKDDLLLSKLQTSSDTGLGSSVVDVRAYLNPNGSTNTQSSGSKDGSLEIVIVIAIVIACVAFLFLVFAIFWAWRYDKKNRDAYMSNKDNDDHTFDGQGSPDTNQRNAAKDKKVEEVPPSYPSYPSVIGGDSVVDGVYPESVISEDITSSLSQYYQSGLQNYTHTNNRLQDAGSVSSMESYGYSLDGYAPSLATNLHADLPLAPSDDDRKREL